MATVPNLESLLLSVHDAMGCAAPRKKQELVDLRRPIEKHLEVLGGLVGDILESLGAEPGEALDGLLNLEEFANFHKTIELRTWTFGASRQHILWHLMACVYMPGLGRRVAFWQLAQAMDADMSGGLFWYLPHPDPSAPTSRLRLPVATVLDWLEDLLGCKVHKATDHWPDPDLDVEAVKKTLDNWRAGDVPRREAIERYFEDGTGFRFDGCLEPREGGTIPEALDAVLQFVDRKGLDAAKLRREIPLTGPGLLESVLDGSAEPALKEHFVRLAWQRYARPTLATVRRRLLVARATQMAYLAAHKLFSDGKALLDPDPRGNKALQLVHIYARSYNLTVDASRATDDWQEQDAWFEQHLAPWEKEELFLSVLPSRRNSAGFELAERLTQHFEACEPDAPLEDWTWPDPDSLRVVAERLQQRMRQTLAEVEEFEQLRLRLKAGSPWRALQAAHCFTNVRAIAADPEESPRVRQLAGQRLRELASSPTQFLDAVLVEVDLYVGGTVKPVPAEAREIVETLLVEAESNPAKARRRPQILSARARHALNSNDFEATRRSYADALAAALDDGCGDRPGLIARDLFAVDSVLRPRGFSAGNYERHIRLMLAFNVIEGWHEPEKVAEGLRDYFWSDLYRPYPGIPRHKA